VIEFPTQFWRVSSMGVINVEIVRLDHFTVRWAKSEDPTTYAGIVAVTSPKVAKALKEALEAGKAPAYAIKAALTPPALKRPGWAEIGVKYGAVGGKKRAANMSPRKRKAAARAAALARWGKTPKQEEGGQ